MTLHRDLNPERHSSMGRATDAFSRGELRTDALARDLIGRISGSVTRLFISRGASALFLFTAGRRQPPLSQQIRARACQPSVTMPQFFGIEIPKGEVRFRPVLPPVFSRFAPPPAPSAR